jgi:acyl-CoA thioesterase-2
MGSIYLSGTTHMTDPDNFNTQEILDLLQLEQVEPNHFRGQSHFMGSPNVFGGQVLGQSLYAASHTVDGRRPHSLHSLFILPGNHRLPIDFEVERVRDGGTFNTRRVVATQEGRRIFVLSASFQVAEEGLSHQRSMPPAGDPEQLPSSLPSWRKLFESAGRTFMPVPLDFRVDRADGKPRHSASSPFKQIWVKSPIVLPDDPGVHENLFAYVSDYGLLTTSLQPHGIQMGDSRLQIASLDHTIWFHRPFRMDEWLLFSIESTNAAGGRGLNFSHVYNQRGELVVTVAQEGLIRLRAPKPAPAA